MVTYEDEISDELGQEAAFTKPLTQKPSGARVSAPKVPNIGDEALSVQDTEDTLEDDLEKILMMEKEHVGK